MADEEPIPTLPEKGRRLETPARAKLLAHYETNEQLSRGILNVEIGLTFAAIGWVIFFSGKTAGLFSYLAAAIGFFGIFYGFLPLVLRSKLRVEDIRPDARFGVHSRASLTALTARVFARLKLPPRACPVYMVREKETNAMALRCDLLPGVRLFNGVYLNRAIIHLLDEPELESVVGHELGHAFPYAPLLSRCYLFHGAFCASLSFAIATAFPHPGIAIAAPIVCIVVLQNVIGFMFIRIIRAIEFLCDDYGARAAGLLPALSCEFKMGAEAEARQQIIGQLLEASATGKQIAPDELYEIYDEAVPFGRADPETTRAEIERIAKRRTVENQKNSLGGFLQFLGGGGDTEAHAEFAREQLARQKLVAQLPLIPLDRQPYLKGSAFWTPALAAHLTETIEANPAALLFRSPHEISDQSDTHPNTSRRMLFLWRNRGA